MTRSLRALRVVLGVILALAVLPVAGVGWLYWRLTQGPMDVTGLAQHVLVHFAPGVVLNDMTVFLVERDLRVAVTGVHAEGVANGPGLAQVTAVIEGTPLLHLRVRPRDVVADGVRVHVVKAADGRLSVTGLPGSYLPAEPRHTPGEPDTVNDYNYPSLLGGLVHVGVHDLTVTMLDVASHQTGTLQDLVADMRRDKSGGLSGELTTGIVAGSVTTQLTVSLSRDAADAPIMVRAAIGAVNPAAIAPMLPVLAPLAAFDAPLALAADATFSPDFDLQHADLHAQGGPGVAMLPKKKGGTAPANFTSVTVDAAGDLHQVSLTGLKLVVTPPPPSAAPPATIMVTGEAMRDAQHATARLHLALDQAQMADLPAIWPEGVGGGARPWLVENVPIGSAHDGAFDLVLEAGPKLDDVHVTSLTGTLPAEDVTLYWLKPVPPLIFPHVLLTMVDSDTMTLTSPLARQGALVARQVQMTIWGMLVKDQTSQIDGDITAPIADVFTLLGHSKLRLLSTHPLPIGAPTGQSVTHLTVKLPLESHLTMDMVDIHAASHLTDVRIPNVAAGRTLDRGVFDLDVTQAGLTLNGKARLAGIPAAANVAMDFRGGPPDQVTTHVTATAKANDKAMAAAGLDTIGLLSGTVSAAVDYTEYRNGRAVLQANGDLGDAALSTPLGWSKPAGPAASIAATAELSHGQLVGFDGIRAEGPGLSVQGSSEMVNGVPSVLHVDRCVIGRTNVAGTLTFPAKPGDALRVVLAGPMLDISGPLSSKTTFEPSTPDKVTPGRPYQVDLRFERVLLNEKAGVLGPVTLTARGDDRRIAQARLTAGGADQVFAEIEPRGEERSLRVRVADAGLLLSRAGLGSSLDQGALTVDGVFDDRRAGSPLSATMELAQFGVHDLAMLGKILQGMTLYGLLDALRGPGLRFDLLTLPFTYTNGVLNVREVRAFSSSLGVTAQGWVDLRRNLLALNGTIVPAYFFNSLLGRVPVLGHIFSPEVGGGVFAATYSISGAAANPAVSVNPLAALTPGALRGLFGLFN